MIYFFFVSVPAIIGVAVFLLSSYGRGLIGLVLTRVLIGSNKPKKSKYVVRNLIFKHDNRTIKIDYLMIDPLGVHVIEVLNMKGTIMGRENDLEWTYSVDHGLTKNKFYSPVKKNSGHIAALKDELKSDAMFLSYVVFTNRSSIAIKTQHVTVEFPLAFIQAYRDKKTDHPLEHEHIESIYNAVVELKKNNAMSKKQYKELIEQESKEVKKIKTKTKTKKA